MATTTNNVGQIIMNPDMTPEQMEIFQREALWNDGWFQGEKYGTQQAQNTATTKGIVAGLLVGVAATAAGIFLWNKTKNENKKSED